MGCGLWVLLLAAFAALAGGSALSGYAFVARDLPRPDELQARASQFASTRIYDRNGTLVNEVGDPNFGRRTAVSLDRISPYLVDATLATEDPNFYRHAGVDPVGLLRAVYYAVRDRDLNGPGGSTITQQLVKLTFLSSERTLTRKVKEAILASEITRRYPKDRILEIYLNEIFYGNLAYGIEAAAETYFGKPAAELTLAEAALLAGLPQAPAYYDPYTKLWEGDPDRGEPGPVKRRQGEVLRLMVERQVITAEQADAAWQEPITLRPLRQVYASKYPHYLLYARAELERALGPELVAKGGLEVHTVLDPAIQDAAEEEVGKQIEKLAKQGAGNGAVVAVRPETGEVLAMVGSADFGDERISGQVNMALAPRQPGSALKPLVYLSTFEMPAEAQPPALSLRGPVAPTPSGEGQGGAPASGTAIEPAGNWSPATALMDVRTEFPDGVNPPYVPVNYDGKEHGLVSARTALANSLNIPAVKALQHAGIERFKDVVRRAGITSLDRPDFGLSLALGGGEVNLLEMTGAFATLANQGLYARPSPIGCVLDGEGNLIWRGAAAAQVVGCLGTAPAAGAAVAVTPSPVTGAFDPQNVYQVTSILTDVEARKPMFGSAAAVMTLKDRPAAVKTGTTNDYRDAWTLGYTPDLAVGVWVGNADYAPMQKLAGSLGAAPIWHGVMTRALQGTPPRAFSPPLGVQQIEVCKDSGSVPGPACPARRGELFADGKGPLSEEYDLWQMLRLDRLTGALANPFTPADRIEERPVMLFPEPYAAWAAAHGYPVYDGSLAAWAFEPELALESPSAGSTVAGRVPVYGRVRLPDPLVWRLEYGVGPDPQGWGVLTGPLPADPADVSSRERQGMLGEWDTAATVAAHGALDYTLRLAAYDPGNMDYPVATSGGAYVSVAGASPVPLPTETTMAPTTWAPSTPTDTPTPLPSPAPSLTPAPSATPSPPSTGVSATPTATDTPAPTPTMTPAPGSGSVRAAILEPGDGAVVGGQVNIIGVADGAGFAGYRLEVGVGESPADDSWAPVMFPSSSPVTGGLLGVWETAGLPAGIYSLRLTVNDQFGGGASDVVRLLLQTR